MADKMSRATPFLLLVVCAVVVGCAPGTPDQIHDSEAVLLKIFTEERESFDKLISMIEEDRHMQRIDDNWTLPDPPGISEARLAEYRRLLERIGCSRGFENFDGKDEIAFIASASGWATSGSSKGYVYTKRPQLELVDSLDGPFTTQQLQTGVRRHIEGNWYLFCEK